MKCQTSSIAFHANEWLIREPNAEIAIGDGRRTENGSEKETVYGHYRDCCEISGLKPFSLVGYSNNLIDLLTDSLGWEVSKVRTRTGMKIKGIRLRQPGIDDQIPRIDESFNIDPPLPPDDTPPDNRPQGNPPPSTPDPSGEGVVKGSVGLCEGLKPALDMTCVGFEGLNPYIDLNEQDIALEQLAEVPQHQNIEETPPHPTQPIQGFGFNPTHDPKREGLNPTHELSRAPGAEPESATEVVTEAVAIAPPQTQQKLPAVTPDAAKTSSRKLDQMPVKEGESVQYTGTKYQQYKNLPLTIHGVDAGWGVASCRTPDGSITTWMPLADLKRV